VRAWPALIGESGAAAARVWVGRALLLLAVQQQVTYFTDDERTRGRKHKYMTLLIQYRIYTVQ